MGYLFGHSPVEFNLKEHGKDEHMQTYSINDEKDSRATMTENEPCQHVQYSLQWIERIESSRLLLSRLKNKRSRNWKRKIKADMST